MQMPDSSSKIIQNLVVTLMIVISVAIPFAITEFHITSIKGLLGLSVIYLIWQYFLPTKKKDPYNTGLPRTLKGYLEFLFLMVAMGLAIQESIMMIFSWINVFKNFWR
jgi:hypothetical protein